MTFAIRWASALLLAVLAGPALGATLTWTGGVGANWADAGNWAPTQVPADGDGDPVTRRPGPAEKGP